MALFPGAWGCGGCGACGDHARIVDRAEQTDPVNLVLSTFLEIAQLLFPKPSWWLQHRDQDYSDTHAVWKVTRTLPTVGLVALALT